MEDLGDGATIEELKELVRERIRQLECSKHPETKNPFKAELTISNCSLIKMIFFCFLVPLRLVLLLILLLTCNIVASLCLIGYKDCDPPQPLKGFSKRGQQFLYFLTRVMLAVCGFHHIIVKGKVSPKARIIAAAPHSSFMDGFIISVIGPWTGVSRAENVRIPLFGNALRIMQPTFVSRTDRNSKRSVIKEIKRKVEDESWPPTLLFAEGTCTNRKTFTFFKPGAFYPGVPVQPVIVRYPDIDNNLVPDFATWTWIGPSIFPLIFIMLSQIQNTAEVEVLPLYVPTEQEVLEPLTYAKNVRDYMARMDNRPTSDHSFEDARLMMEAKKYGLPMEAGLIEYHKINPMLGIDCDRMIEYLQEFSQMNTSRSGFVSLEELSKFLHVPHNGQITKVLDIYSSDSGSSLSFRDYLVACITISNMLDQEENTRQIFDLLFKVDTDSDLDVSERFARALARVLQLPEKDISSCGHMTDNILVDEKGKVTYEMFREWCHKSSYQLLLLTYVKEREHYTSNKTHFES